MTTTLAHLTFSMTSSQFVQNNSGVKASVVAQLAGNHLQGLGESSHEQLLLAGNGTRVLTQVFTHLQLHSTTTWGQKGKNECVIVLRSSIHL